MVFAPVPGGSFTDGVVQTGFVGMNSFFFGKRMASNSDLVSARAIYKLGLESIQTLHANFVLSSCCLPCLENLLQ